MQNAISVFLSTSFVAVLAIVATPYTAAPPNPGPESPAAYASLVAEPAAQTQWQSELLTAIGELKRKLGETSGRSIDTRVDLPTIDQDSSETGFDSGGSDGVSDNSTWPAPPSTPRANGSGSTGGQPAGYAASSRRIIRYSYPVGSPVIVSSGSTGGYLGNSTTSYGSTGGYSSPAIQSTPMFGRSIGSFGTTRPGLFQRVRAVRAADCPGGVCNF